MLHSGDELDIGDSVQTQTEARATGQFFISKGKGGKRGKECYFATGFPEVPFTCHLFCREYLSQAQSVLQKLRGKPLCFHMIRWKWHDGSIYRPLVPHLQVLQQDIPNFKLKYDNASSEEKPEDFVQDGRFLYSLRYLGQVNIGMYGGKEVLDAGITKVLEQNQVPQEVLFDVKETEVISLKRDFSQVLFHHHYPEISSVGHRVDKRTVFAYCVADSPESPHTCSFICLVFETKSEKDADEIIMRIAAGFRNTEWFV